MDHGKHDSLEKALEPIGDTPPQDACPSFLAYKVHDAFVKLLSADYMNDHLPQRGARVGSRKP